MQYINLAFTILFILVLSLVSMFFYGIGVDDTGYLEHWNNVLPLSEYIFSDNKLSEIGLEWFYLVLFSFFKLFTNDISIFKFFNTFVSLSILAYSYYKITHRYYFILLLYILIYLFIDVYINQYRSGLASSFGVLAIVLLSEGKIKSSLLWLLVGALIHNSQFWLVVVYICILFPNIRKFLVFVLVILVFIPGKADVILSILKYFDLIYIRDGNVYLLTDIKFSTDIISHILRKIISYAHKSTKLDSISLFSFVISKTIIIYIFIKI